MKAYLITFIVKQCGRHVRNGAASMEKQTEEELYAFHRDNLTAFVITALRTCGVAGNTAATFGTSVQLGCAPAVSAATHTLFHLGGSTLWCCHNRVRLKWLFGVLLEGVEGIPHSRSSVSAGGV